jgi:hypothetical protein
LYIDAHLWCATRAIPWIATQVRSERCEWHHAVHNGRVLSFPFAFRISQLLQSAAAGHNAVRYGSGCVGVAKKQVRRTLFPEPESRDLNRKPERFDDQAIAGDSRRIPGGDGREL